MTGIFDSGIGGLFVLKDLIKQFSNVPFVYLADTKYFPYGEKKLSCIHSLVKKNVEFLLSHGVDNIIVACNTASAVLDNVRYDVPVMGIIEPAIRQAQACSQSGKVVVLATEATVKSCVYLKKNRDLATGLHIYQQACPLLAPFIESGKWKTHQKELWVLLDEYLKPFSNKKVDTIILGCTHYLCLKLLIRKYIGGVMQVVGPVHFLIKHLKERGFCKIKTDIPKRVPVFVSGNVDEFSKKSSEGFRGLKFYFRTV